MLNASKKHLTSALLGASLLFLAAPASWGADPVDAAADLVVLRPAGIAGTAIGTGAFLASLPVTYVNGTSRQTAEDLVMKPFRFTFQRPLGSSY